MNKPALLILSALTAGHATAEIYFWRDAAGHPHFSDRNHAKAQALAIDPGIAWLTVKKVIDGDTILLNDGTTVRLLSINTPEIDTPRKPGEPGGAAAKAALIKLLAGQRVRLEQDLERRDHYGRTLAQVFTESGLHVNAELLRQGWATLNIHPPNLNYLAELESAQQSAERQQSGIWKLPAYQSRAASEIDRKAYQRGWQRVHGRLESIGHGRRYLYLNLSGQVSAQIAKDALKLFPDFKTWQGRQIELRGWLHRAKKGLTMRIRHPSAIRLRR